jgi:hypothetical protein
MSIIVTYFDDILSIFFRFPFIKIFSKLGFKLLIIFNDIGVSPIELIEFDMMGGRGGVKSNDWVRMRKKKSLNQIQKSN